MRCATTVCPPSRAAAPDRSGSSPLPAGLPDRRRMPRSSNRLPFVSACLFEAPAVCVVNASPSSRACWHSVVVGRVEGAAPDHVREDIQRHLALLARASPRWHRRYWAAGPLPQVPIRTSRHPSRGQIHMCTCVLGQIRLKFCRSHGLQSRTGPARPVTTALHAGSARACTSATCGEIN